MRQNIHTSPILRVLTACVALLLIGIILLKPHSGFFSDEDAETLEMTVQLDEIDFEKESFTEIDTDFDLATVVLDPFVHLEAQHYGIPRDKSLRLMINDIFLPPPEL